MHLPQIVLSNVSATDPLDIPFNSSLEFKQSIDIIVWERDGVYVSWSDNTQATQFTIQQQDVLGKLNKHNLPACLICNVAQKRRKFQIE